MKRPILAVLFFTLIGLAAQAQSADGALAFNASGLSSTHALALAGGLGVDDPTVIFYPNPVKTTLNVKFPQKGMYTVRIYNIVGEKIAEKSVMEEDTVRLNLSDLSSGMFFLTYEFEGKVVTKRFSKAQ